MIDGSVLRFLFTPRTIKISTYASLLGAIVGSVVFFLPNVVERRAILTSQTQAVSVEAELVKDELQEILADTYFLSRLSCMPTLFSPNPADRAIAYRNVQKDFLAFSAAKSFYDQLRVIDETGTELIRVNYQGGKAILVAQEDLQNKADRYYFTETIKLDYGQAYLSPFDLNIEHGTIEVPLKPMIRLGTPLVDEEGRKRGIVVVNYKGQTLLERLDRVASIGNLHFFLLNQEGYWLRGPTRKDEWGFMYPDRQGLTIRETFPDAADFILKNQDGIVETPSGLFSIATVQAPVILLGVGLSDLSVPDGFEPWKCISFISRKTLQEGRLRRLEFIIAVWLALSLIVWILVSGWVRSDQLRSQVEEDLRSAKAAAESANRSKSIFLANMSHEIRTPMNAVLGFADLLLSGEKDGLRQKYLQAIASSGATLLTIINDLLDLSKIEAGKISLSLEATDLLSLIEELRYIYSSVAEKKGLYLRVESDEGVPDALLLDRVRMRQILVNLIGNAIKFTERGGILLRIRITHRDVDAMTVGLRIDVVDTGIGIAATDQERIFGAFEQAPDAWSGKYGGTGLGLSIAKRLVELMGGRLELESQVGEGSVFSVLLPQRYETTRAIEGKIEQGNKKQEPHFGPARLLLVDDVPENNLLIRGFLASYPFSFREASNGAAALDLLNSFRPNIIITDLKMPVMNGFELLERIKQDPEYASIPVILLTASITKQDEKQMSIRADSYLHKPLKRDLFLAELTRYLSVLPVPEVENGAGEEALAPTEVMKEGNLDLATPAKSPSQARDVDRFIATVKRDMLPRIETIGDHLLLGEIEDILNLIQGEATDCGIDEASLWCGDLRRAVDGLNFPAIRAGLTSFSALLEDIASRRDHHG